MNTKTTENTGSVSRKKYEEEVNLKNQAYYFIMQYNLIELFSIYCKEEKERFRNSCS